MINTNIALVNGQDHLIGETDVISAHLGVGTRHRAISVFLFNKRGELLIQQRSEKKIVGALQWANTCCGNVRVNETREECAYRRLREELGITDVSISPLEMFEYHVQCNERFSEWEIDEVFFGQFDGIPHINTLEVQSTSWKTLGDIKLHATDAPKYYAPWFRLLLGHEKVMQLKN